MSDAHEIFRFLPFPFEGDEFPLQLGAVVQRTVLSGDEPAREVIHAPEGDWYIADGVNDPNLPDAVTATHISHAIALNGSIRTLATLPPGRIAKRSDPSEPWSVFVFEGWAE